MGPWCHDLAKEDALGQLRSLTQSGSVGAPTQGGAQRPTLGTTCEGANKAPPRRKSPKQEPNTIPP